MKKAEEKFSESKRAPDDAEALLNHSIHTLLQRTPPKLQAHRRPEFPDANNLINVII